MTPFALPVTRPAQLRRASRRGGSDGDFGRANLEMTWWRRSCAWWSSRRRNGGVLALLVDGRRRGEAREWRGWRAATAYWQLELASVLASGGGTGA
jgi:hypothetical protein